MPTGSAFAMTERLTGWFDPDTLRSAKSMWTDFRFDASATPAPRLIEDLEEVFR